MTRKFIATITATGIMNIIAAATAAEVMAAATNKKLQQKRKQTAPPGCIPTAEAVFLIFKFFV